MSNEEILTCLVLFAFVAGILLGRFARKAPSAPNYLYAIKMLENSITDGTRSIERAIDANTRQMVASLREDIAHNSKGQDSFSQGIFK